MPPTVPSVLVTKWRLRAASAIAVAGFMAFLSVEPSAAADWYLRAGIGLDRPGKTVFADRDCSSASPAALYGCGTGGDGAPYRSVGDFGTAMPLELGLGYTVTPAARLEALVEYRTRFGFKGGIGLVADVAPEVGDLTARFEGRDLAYGFGKLETMMVPPYSATVRKSQGSEYPPVVIPVLTQNYAIPKRSLLYTGVMRGKRLVVLVGQKKTVTIAARNASGRRRWSRLDESLAGATDGPERRGTDGARSPQGSPLNVQD